MTNKESLLIKIEEYLNENPDYSNKRIANLMVGKGDNFGYSFATLQRSLIKKVRLKLNMKVRGVVTTVQHSTNADSTPLVSQKPVVHESQPGIEQSEDPGYTIEDVAIIMAAYTKKGVNLTWAQTQNLHILSPDLMNTVKLAYSITKDSEPYPEVYNLSKSEDEIDEIVAANVATVFKKYASDFSPSITGAIRQLKKETFEAHQQKKQLKEVLHDLKNYLGEIDFKRLYSNPYKLGRDADKGNEVIIIGDMHLSMKGKFFSYENAEDMLEQILDHLDPGVSYTIILLGDILHTVLGANHANTWQDMDVEQGFGAEGIIKAFKVLLKFMICIPKLTNVSIVGGNHDRLSNNRDEDQDDGGARLIAEMLDISLPRTVIDFDPACTIIDVDNIRYINKHGDLRADKAAAKDMVMEHGDLSKFNLISIGHLHHLDIPGKDQGNNYIKVLWPAFCPPDKYAERGGYTNAFPGFGIVKDTGFGKPNIQIIPLDYERLNKNK